MEQRYLGRSGFKVPALGFGAGTFGGEGPLFSAWGNTDVAGARRIVDICLDAARQTPSACAEWTAPPSPLQEGAPA